MNVSPIKQPGALLPLVMFWVALAGAVAAAVLVLYAGHRNNSLVLLTLFAIWVSSPFVALTWFNRISQRWPVFTRTMLYGVTLILVVGALAIYENMASAPPGSKLAFPFLMVPHGVLDAYRDSHPGSRGNIKWAATCEVGHVVDQGCCDAGHAGRARNHGAAGIAVAGP